jgi:hypothetical protein
LNRELLLERKILDQIAIILGHEEPLANLIQGEVIEAIDYIETLSDTTPTGDVCGDYKVGEEFVNCTVLK